MKKDHDPVLGALLRKNGPEQPDDDVDQDQQPDREDPSLVAAEELAQALRRGDAAAIRDAFQTMLEALQPQGAPVGSSARSRP